MVGLGPEPWRTAQDRYIPRMTDAEFLTVDEFAARVRCIAPTVRGWISRGELAAHLIGGRWLIPRAAALEFIERRAARPHVDVRAIDPTRPHADVRAIQPTRPHGDVRTTQPAPSPNMALGGRRR